ncbi:unnamed protein product, partial [Brenthis ino]
MTLFHPRTLYLGITALEITFDDLKFRGALRALHTTVMSKLKPLRPRRLAHLVISLRGEGVRKKSAHVI